MLEYNIILASASPRRAELLKDAGLRYSLAPKFEFEETYPNNIQNNKIAEYLAEIKSEKYPYHLSDSEILLTADTTVIVDGQHLDKPLNYAEAIEMLNIISGNTHHVITAVCLRSKNNKILFSEKTEVIFNPIPKNIKMQYIESKAPFDKAGGYGIQDNLGLLFVKEIKGSYSNVIGLPVARLFQELEKL